MSENNIPDFSEKKAHTTDVRKLTKAEVTERAEKIKLKNRQERIARSIKRAPVVGLVRMGTTVAAVAVVLGVGGWVLGSASGYESKINANNDKINSLTADLNNIKTEKSNIPDSAVLAKGIEDANVQAKSLLNIQNAMIDRAGDNSDESVLEYGRLVDESRNYISRGSLNGGDFLPHGRWYQAYEVRNVPGRDDGSQEWAPIPRDRWSWTVKQATDVTNNGEVPVIWEARFTEGDRNNEQLAWVKALYDPGRNLFHSFEKGLTPTGKDFEGATTPESASNEQKASDARDPKPVPEDSEVLKDALKSLDEARARGGSRGQGNDSEAKPTNETTQN